MKKISKKAKYLRYQRKRHRCFLRSIKRPKYNDCQVNYEELPDNTSLDSNNIVVVEAPVNFRFIENTSECSEFFRNLRNKRLHNKVSSGYSKIRIDLSHVQHIDYASLTVLTAISEYFKDERIQLQGNMPRDHNAKKMLKQSGFLDHLYFDGVNNNHNNSVHLSLNLSKGILSQETQKEVVKKLNQVASHLNIDSIELLPLKTMIWEICNNAIEWADTTNKQWILAINFDQNKVIFSFVDIGRGIMKSLGRKFRVLFDQLSNDPVTILKNAFEQKYGSTSREINRNKGLPCVKSTFDQNIISSLKVITNEVLLDFENVMLSKRINNGCPRFRGTFYTWEVKRNNNGK